MAESRKERRRKQKAEERKRQDDVNTRLEEPKLPSFEPPPTGHVVDDPTRQKV